MVYVISFLKLEQILIFFPFHYGCNLCTSCCVSSHLYIMFNLKLAPVLFLVLEF